MDRTSIEVPLDGWDVVVPAAGELRLRMAEVSVDDRAWGSVAIDEVQRRLEDADDFAIVLLRAGFRSEGELVGLTVEANAEGQRNMIVDRGYMVPDKAPAPAGFCRYLLPSPLPAGDHLFTWSYAWNPPRDRTSGAPLSGGVTLAAPVIRGAFRAQGTTLGAWPASVRLGEGPLPARAERRVEVPAFARAVKLDLPVPDAVGLELDGVPLVPDAGSTGLFPLPPGSGRFATLALKALVPGATSPRAIRILG